MAPPPATVMPSSASHFAESNVSPHYSPFAQAFSIPASAVASSESTFEDVVKSIRAILGPSSGIDSADVDVESIMQVMRAYNPATKSEQWRQFALADPSRAYTRNGVDECNDKANLLILVWNPTKGSMIHDHANAHCVMKILQGQLVETLYEWPEEESTADANGHHAEHSMTIKKETTLNTGDVAYMSDTLGLHRMSNPSQTEPAVSLHLYTPPHAAKFGCLIFEENSGKRHQVKMSNLYSNHGALVKDGAHDSC